MSHFEFSKWYMDSVSDDGRVFIGYAATLRWRGLKINYSSTLRHHRGATNTSTSLTHFSTPQESVGQLRWCDPNLGVEGTWTGADLPIERTIFTSSAGSVEWRCLVPHALVEMQTADDLQTKDLGYAEHLLMSLPPWGLPIDELRWGRFLTDDDALIWIDWRGPVNTKLVFLNGVQLEGALITNDGIVTDDVGVSLSFDDAHVIREGPLIQTALSAIPGIQTLIPARSLYANECKWLSHASLKKQAAVSTGWAIHELVRWPKD